MRVKPLYLTSNLGYSVMAFKVCGVFGQTECFCLIGTNKSVSESGSLLLSHSSVPQGVKHVA